MIYQRGDIVISSIGGISGKPRPWVIIQNNLLNSNLFTTLAAPITSEVKIEQEDFRVILKPNEDNNLKSHSQVMLDRISVMDQKKIMDKIGVLSMKELRNVNQALAFVMGF
jgi:mRNA interferase MazF